MRDLEFLPEWYPLLRRRRHLLVVEAWLSLVIIGGLGLWMVLSSRNVHAAEAVVNNLNGQLQQSNIELQKLNELQALQARMSQQAQVVADLGPHVPTARMIDVLDDAMPRDMALLDLSIDTERQMKPGVTVNPTAKPQFTRQLRVRVHGVAPNDVDLGNFLAKLAGIPHFNDIAMPYSKPRVDQGHLMREFEVTFAIDLDDQDR